MFLENGVDAKITISTSSFGELSETALPQKIISLEEGLKNMEYGITKLKIILEAFPEEQFCS